MEKQDVKIGRINALKGATPVDLTAVMLKLQSLTSRLEEQTSDSKDHSDRLESIENLMSKMLDELVAIKEILASSRGIRFVPESDDSD